MDTDLQTLLGKRANRQEVKAFLESFGKTPSLEQDEDDGSFFLELPKDGISFLFDEDLYLKTIHLYSGREADEGYQAYKLNLPEGLGFQITRSEVQKLIGPPSIVGKDGIDVLGRPIPPWDRYDKDTFSLHIQYSSRDQKITLLTLMLAGKNAKGERDLTGIGR